MSEPTEVAKTLGACPKCGLGVLAEPRYESPFGLYGEPPDFLRYTCSVCGYETYEPPLDRRTRAQRPSMVDAEQEAKRPGYAS